MKLANKVVVVTGAGNGLGRELTRQLVTRGARVAAVDINADGLKETLAALASSSVADFALSVADKEAVDALPAQVIARFGSVDGVINCAGVLHPFAPFHTLEWSAIERVLDVNLKGTLHVLRAFLPHLLARPEGHVLNIASMGGFIAVPGQTIYCASKAAVKLLTEGIHFELLKTNVRVSLALPGALETNILTNSGIPVPPGAANMPAPLVTSAPSAAKQILDGMEANAYHILVGRDAKLMNAFNRLSPRRAAATIAKQLGELLNVG
ncbi:MAG: SDR family oxidoreductase [Polyangiales bacterium]